MLFEQVGERRNQIKCETTTENSQNKTKNDNFCRKI
jgi:hypothetical protein